MAHNLNFVEGKASMFYVGDPPWHQLGQRLDNPATSEEAIRAAVLDYTVSKKPLKAVLRTKKYTDISDHFATVRTDTGDVLGVVGGRYSPIQNRDAFTFFDSLVGAGEAIYHSAGALGRGERIWILAKLPGYIKVHGEDIVEKFLLLTNSHDGSCLVRTKLTPIRVVCQNTLTAALSGLAEEVRIRHTPNAVSKLEQAHKLLGLTNVLYDQLEQILGTMANQKMSSVELLAYVSRVIPSPVDEIPNTRTSHVRDRILELHESGRGAEMSRGSLWSAYNAVTEYTDHVLCSNDPERRMKSIWFGGGEKLKQRAFKIAQMLLN
jgi:phage/plasmid-like protein (TIGR03299 family)